MLITPMPGVLETSSSVCLFVLSLMTHQPLLSLASDGFKLNIVWDWQYVKICVTGYSCSITMATA